MPLRPEKPKTPPSDPRKDRQRDQHGMIVENADTKGCDRDLARGEGGTIAIPGKPEDLNRDD